MQAGKEFRQDARIYRIFLCFSLYFIVILLLNFIVNSNDITIFLIVVNMYYAILLTIFILLITYFWKMKNNQFYKLILSFLLIGLLLPLGKWMLLRKIGAREELTFNNANQLGFFALCNFSILFYRSK